MDSRDSKNMILAQKGTTIFESKEYKVNQPGQNLWPGWFYFNN